MTQKWKAQMKHGEWKKTDQKPPVCKHTTCQLRHIWSFKVTPLPFPVLHTTNRYWTTLNIYAGLLSLYNEIME